MPLSAFSKALREHDRWHQTFVLIAASYGYEPVDATDQGTLFRRAKDQAA